MERVSVNQDLTKTRNKIAYDACQLVKQGNIKSTFVWDSKLILIDHSDTKHKVLSPTDMDTVLNTLGISPR
jgi:hypothetical protein